MHEWQDYVLALGSVIFTLALVPSLKSKNKPAIVTSLSTSSVLFVFAITFVTMSLWYSAIAAFVNGMAWLALAMQEYIQKVQ